MEEKTTKALSMVVLPVSDWEKARKWYTEKLGFKPVYEVPDDRWGEYSLGDGSGATLGLWGLPAGYTVVHGDGLKAVAPQPYIKVDDLEKVVEELTKRGVEFEQVFSEEEYRTARLLDPEGHVLYLYEFAEE